MPERAGLRGLWRRVTGAGAGPAFDTPLAPEGVVSVVGDVHGRADLLARLLPRLPGQVVLVGDLIDRGEQSAQVLDMARAAPGVVCLMGNHEAMLLEFLDDPEALGRRWLRNGGLQTLASFGVGGDPGGADLPRLRDRLALAMGDARIDWLRGLPLWWQSGNLVVSHAGGNPGLPMAAQDAVALTWGHPAFASTPRRDGLWMAHGHVIVEQAAAEAGRIATDTGAFATGRLSAAVVEPGALRFEVA